MELARPHLAIRVNQLALGYFPSQMTPVETEGEKDFFRKKWQIPFGRAGTPPDISRSVLSLATNEYQTNSTEIIDGAYTLCSDRLNLERYV